MGALRTISLLLVIIGAVNWLLVGLFGFDLVAAITGNDFGEKNTISSVIYVLVGLAGLALLMRRRWGGIAAMAAAGVEEQVRRSAQEGP